MKTLKLLGIQPNITEIGYSLGIHLEMHQGLLGGSRKLYLRVLAFAVIQFL